jgi:hypothetical protein
VQINYLLKKKAKGFKTKIMKGYSNSNTNFVGYSIYTNPKFKKHFYENIESTYLRLVKEKIEKESEKIIEVDILTDEEKLDKILDKINSEGQSSLTSQEKDFLNYYSNKLN